MEFPLPLLDWLQEVKYTHGLTELSINSTIAVCSIQLPDLHKGPADRLLIATAIEYNLSIITPDQHIHAYPDAKVIW